MVGRGAWGGSSQVERGGTVEATRAIETDRCADADAVKALVRANRELLRGDPALLG